MFGTLPQRSLEIIPYRGPTTKSNLRVSTSARQNAGKSAGKNTRKSAENPSHDHVTIDVYSSRKTAEFSTGASLSELCCKCRP